MKLVIRWLILTVAVMAAIWFLRNVLKMDGIVLEEAKPWIAAAVIAAVLGLLNAFLRPVLKLLSLPLTVITLGLFSFVVNAFILWLSAFICRAGLKIDFRLDFFPEALLAGVIVTVVSSVLNTAFVRK